MWRGRVDFEHYDSIRGEIVDSGSESLFPIVIPGREEQREMFVVIDAGCRRGGGKRIRNEENPIRV